MQEAWVWVQDQLSKTLRKKEHQVNLHRRDPDFDVGDKVWLSTKNLNLDRPSKKLGHQYLGQLRITNRVGWS